MYTCASYLCKCGATPNDTLAVLLQGGQPVRADSQSRRAAVINATPQEPRRLQPQHTHPPPPSPQASCCFDQDTCSRACTYCAVCWQQTARDFRLPSKLFAAACFPCRISAHIDSKWQEHSNFLTVQQQDILVCFCSDDGKVEALTAVDDTSSGTSSSDTSGTSSDDVVAVTDAGTDPFL